jgi:heat shock protein HtpX
MFKRIGLFLLTNFLVMIMAGLVLSLLSSFFPGATGQVTSLAVLCGVFGMGGALISLSLSRIVAKWTYGLKPINRSACSPVEGQVYDMVADLSRQAGIRVMPEVAIYQDADPNAFATGPTRNRSLVAFSTGLLEGMDGRQVEAVAAHEISHISNGDMVTMTLLTGIVNALVMFLSRMVARAIDTFLSDDDGDGLGFLGYYATVMVLDMLFMFLASIPLAWFSRYREYRADAGAARLTSAEAMQAALGRLAEMTGQSKKTVFDTSKINSTSRFSLFSSHPPLADRIRALRK